MKILALTPVVLGLLASLGACTSSGPPVGAATSDGFPAPDKEIIYHYTLQAFEEQGFPVDYDMSSEAAGKVVSRYKISLQPFSGNGHRDKATVTIRECPGRASYYMLDTQVVRELNQNMMQPDNLMLAEWENAQRMTELEELINARIEMNFLPGTLSPEFRQQHGLRSAESVRIDSSTLPPAPPPQQNQPPQWQPRR